MSSVMSSFVAVGAALLSSGILLDDGQTTVVRAVRSCPVELSSNTNTPFHECAVSAGWAGHPLNCLLRFGHIGWPPFELACCLASEVRWGRVFQSPKKPILPQLPLSLRLAPWPPFVLSVAPFDHPLSRAW